MVSLHSVSFNVIPLLQDLILCASSLTLGVEQMVFYSVHLETGKKDVANLFLFVERCS